MAAKIINDPYTSLFLMKLDKTDDTPVAGAKFKVETDTNSLIGTYETDLQGDYYQENSKPFEGARDLRVLLA